MSDIAQLAQIMRTQRNREQAALLSACQNHWQSGVALPTDLLRRVGYAGPEAFRAILDAHPAARVHREVENIRIAFEVLRSAREAILEVYGKFHAQVMHNAKDTNLDGILLQATREVFTFACAASALVQAYRHLQSAAPSSEKAFEELKKEIFSDGQLVAFVQKLRNAFSHTQLFTAQPAYRIELGETRTVSTNLHFNKALLAKEEWSDEARKFIERSEALDVMQITSDYFERAERFYEAFPSRVGILHDQLFKDYCRIKLASEIIGHEIGLGLILQATSKNPLNPYVYLSRYLTPEEVARVACFDDHSKEQVDYIISLRDPLGIAAPGIRASLYKLFGVQATE